MRGLPVVSVAVVFVLAVAAIALAAAEPLPWGGLEIAIGPVVLLWGGVVAAVVELLKHVYFGDRSLLDTPGKIWAANLLLGGVGVFVYELVNGADVLAALLAAGAAVVAASGIFEGFKTATQAGKSSSVASSHSGTG